ncbi:MAG: hypothetical protein ACRDCB_02890 [Clostridium sp.]|uniref:hypothetical protein n=1 Tax=Clostridium TaxID=1485 RepID=UPI00215253AD|nr:hypothetical protein [Clostridium sp. LY3-2]MCR6514807.1 hypothetical protein [Clostridium sp. LY3-2]
MVEIIKDLVNIMNSIHDKTIHYLSSMGYNFTDKELHFIFIGVIGIFIFAFAQVLFRVLAKYSITAVSFIYTFTILIFITVSIEIQQKLTGAGNMEFGDVFWGLYGFIFVFVIYLIIKLIIKGIKYLLNKNNKSSKKNFSKTDLNKRKVK